MSKFKVGDKVVVLPGIYSNQDFQEGIVEIIDTSRTGRIWIELTKYNKKARNRLGKHICVEELLNPDKYYNNYSEKELIHEEIYNSPLYKALNEKE